MKYATLVKLAFNRAKDPEFLGVYRVAVSAECLVLSCLSTFSVGRWRINSFAIDFIDLRTPSPDVRAYPAAEFRPRT